MEFSDNLASLESWAFTSALSGTLFSDAFARDTDALTKALRQSLSRHEPETASVSNYYSYVPATNPESVPGSSSEPESAPKRIGNTIPAGKIGKRKSRAAKRSPTTYITADPANFREMVQKVTGARFGGGSHVPAGSGHVVKPEPQRAVDAKRARGGLAPLDTSAFFMGRDAVVGPSQEIVGQDKASGSGSGSSGGFDSGDFRVFPTLESWNHAM
ncbi:hypothetical protein AAC387_Pa02g4678 [Persea americana]